jgi:hypothetical protein
MKSDGTMPLFLKSVSSSLFTARFFFHTLFRVVRVLKHSSNFLLIPPPLHYHLTFRACILSPWWKGHTLKGRMDSLSAFLSTFVFLKGFSWSLKVTFYVIFPLPYLFLLAKQWQPWRQYGFSLAKSCCSDEWLLYKWLCTYV